ncbi:hypothetical protein KO465_00945 [Candidatus Micrarchaeota archaeon]|nr:hypothetical protein [Candidatus Micrarchaeota archaeon]
MKKIFIVYVYDIKKELIYNDKKNYNTIKTIFYKKLNKLKEKTIFYQTNSKSMLIVPIEYIDTFDHFFKNFKKWVVVFKIITEEIYELN